MKALLFRSRLSTPEEININKIDDIKEILGCQFKITNYHNREYFFIASADFLEKKSIKNYNRWNIFGAFIIFKSKQKEFIDLISMAPQDIAELSADDIKRQNINEEEQMLLDNFTASFTSVILFRKTYERR